MKFSKGHKIKLARSQKTGLIQLGDWNCLKLNKFNAVRFNLKKLKIRNLDKIAKTDVESLQTIQLSLK